MNAVDKLQMTTRFMCYEPVEDVSAAGVRICGATAENPETICTKREELPVYMAALPNGKRKPILKSVMTSACERNCYYCGMRAGRDFQRVTFKPDEMAQAFMQMLRVRVVDGIFLSSGIVGGGIRTQDKILETAEIIRNKLGYRGYVHLKLMPGSEHAQIERAMQLANRVSVNLEAPNDKRLTRLAPMKIFDQELLQSLKWVDKIRRSQDPSQVWNNRWPSITTQFVVGGADETDLELLATTAALTRQLHLARAYFSSFSPVEDTPLENHSPANPQRELRLYQASFLLRDYGFDLEDMPFSSNGLLPLDRDPKQAWATTHLSEVPVELNNANRETLLRIPGIGPKGAQAIITARRLGNLRLIEDLQALGVIASRAAPYILLNGKRPNYQLRMF